MMLRRVLAKKCVRPRGVRGMASAAAAAASKGGWKFSLNPLPGFTKEQGLVDMVLGRSTMPAVPLNVPAYTLAPRPEVQPRTDVKVSRLRNGVKVATRDFQAPVASIGVYVNTGARDETSENAGISHFLETAAFASTRTRTEFRLIRDTSRLGASLSVNAGREFIAYTGEVLANWTRPVVETLGDLVKRPAFIDFELRDLVNHYREEAEHREHNHQLNLMEHVHGAAYGYSTLGSPLYAPLNNLAQFKKPEVLKSFVADHFTADRISVVAVGVPHEYALELAEQEFAELEAGNKKRAASQYVGGDVRMHASPAVHTPHDKNNTHIALAWQGESWNSPDVTAMGVLSAVLGSDKLLGSAAPVGTRAVQTRLNARILASGLASSASAFATPYSDSGLFGVYAVGKPSDASALASALLAEASALSQAVSAEELHRAKLALKHSIAYSADSRNSLLNLIGAQLAVGSDGAVTTPQQWAAAVDGVTAADLQRVAQKLLKTPLTLAASGDLSKLPRYDQLTAQLK